MILSRRHKVRRLGIAAAAFLLILLALPPALGRYGRARLAQVAAELEPRLGTLDPQSFEKPPIADERNAALWLEAGAGAMVWSEHDRQVVQEAGERSAGDWSDELRHDVGQLVARHRPALATLQRAVGLPQSSYRIRYRDGFEAEIPDLSKLLDAARLLRAQARLANADGDHRTVAAAIAALARLAETLQAESTLITAMVGVACEQMALTAAIETVAAPSGGERLAEIEAVLPDTDHRQLLQRVFAAWAAIVTHTLPDGVGRRLTLPERLYLGATGDLLWAGVLEQEANLPELLDLPFGTDPEQFGQTGKAAHRLWPWLGIHEDLQGFRRTAARLQLAQAQRRLLVAAIALRRLAPAGSYPECSRVELLLEPDPFSGRPLLCQPLADGSLRIAVDRAQELLQLLTPVPDRLTGEVILPPP